VTKLQFNLVAVGVAGVVVSLLIQHRTQIQLNSGNEFLYQQRTQLAELATEHGRLLKLAANSSSPRGESPNEELQRLGGEAEELRKKVAELERTTEDKRQKRKSQPAHAQKEVHLPEFYEEQFRRVGGKLLDARNLSSAFLNYALEHDRQFPSDIGQVESYLRGDNRSLTGTNQFDIVFQGSLDRLKNIPAGEIAVVRGQTWIEPNGRQARVYGLACGVGQIVESDDDFKSWEADHIMPPY
jgi:hypothetical protein